MGCGRRVASEKCSRNQGLPPFPAIFRPDNPHKLPRASRLTQGELATSQRKILAPAGFPTLQPARQPGQRPFKPIPPGRMIAPTQGLDDTAHQPATKIGWHASDGPPVDCDTPVLQGLEKLDAGLRGLGLLASTHMVCVRPAGLNSSCQSQANPLETRVGIGRIVDPGNASLGERGRQARPRHSQERSQEANLRPFDESGHAGEPVRAAGAGRTHRDRLGLVIGVMSHQKMKDAAVPAGLAQQAIAGVAGGLLKASLRLRAGPAQNDAFDALPLEHARRRQRFVRRFRS
ncbi:MAG: hypothetical protein JWQ58_698 [Reyranella sp.]|nr:hypothetical protein [Reyranella sp.]